MRKVLALYFVVFILSGCTHGSISSVPMHLDGQGAVYRYQGRANFAHQTAEADRMLTEHCKQLNGGRPAIVDLQKRELGVMVMGGSQSHTRVNGNVTGTPNSANFSGVATTNTSGSLSSLRNFNQEIAFKCVAE